MPLSFPLLLHSSSASVLTLCSLSTGSLTRRVGSVSRVVGSAVLTRLGARCSSPSPLLSRVRALYGHAANAIDAGQRECGLESTENTTTPASPRSRALRPARRPARARTLLLPCRCRSPLRARGRVCAASCRPSRRSSASCLRPRSRRASRAGRTAARRGRSGRRRSSRRRTRRRGTTGTTTSSRS